MLFVLVALFTDLFLWVPSTGLMAVLVFLAGIGCTCLLIGIVHSLFGRFRIDQATWWLFKFPLVLSIIAIFWAAIPRYFL